MDQGGQASGEDDAPELSSVPVQRGQAVAERDRLQPREPVAATGAAAEGGQVVADRLTATAGEDRRQAHQARTVLLATAEGRDGAVSVEWSRKAGLRGFGAVRQGKNPSFRRRVRRPGGRIAPRGIESRQLGVCWLGIGSRKRESRPKTCSPCLPIRLTND
jgi:hypothetical protein